VIAVPHWPLTPAEQARLKLSGRIRHVLTEPELAAAEQRTVDRERAQAVRAAEALLTRVKEA